MSEYMDSFIRVAMFLGLIICVIYLWIELPKFFKDLWGKK